MPRYADIVESNPLKFKSYNTLCVQIPQPQLLIALMESYGLEVETLHEKEGSRCVMSVNGGQCVTDTGEQMMLK